MARQTCVCVGEAVRVVVPVAEKTLPLAGVLGAGVYVVISTGS